MNIVKFGLTSLCCSVLATLSFADPQSADQAAATDAKAAAPVAQTSPAQPGDAAAKPGQPPRDGKRGERPDGPRHHHFQQWQQQQQSQCGCPNCRPQQQYGYNCHGYGNGPQMQPGFRNFGQPMPMMNPLLLLLKNAKVDKDQPVTKEALHAAVDKLFDQIDTAKTGKLTVKDIASSGKQFRHGRHHDRDGAKPADAAAQAKPADAKPADVKPADAK